MLAVGASTARVFSWQLASVLQDASNTRAALLAQEGHGRISKHLYLDVEHGSWNRVRRHDGLDGLAVGQDHGDLLAGGPARAKASRRWRLEGATRRADRGDGVLVG